MSRYEPVTTTASVVITANAFSFGVPIIETTTFSDQAIVTTTSLSTAWGPITTTLVTESKSAIFSSPV